MFQAGPRMLMCWNTAQFCSLTVSYLLVFLRCFVASAMLHRHTDCPHSDRELLVLPTLLIVGVEFKWLSIA